jgi:hypothetical protein
VATASTSGAPPSPGPAGAKAVATDGALAYLVAQAGFAAAAVPMMVAICLAESGGDCFAVSTAGDYGVAQINYPAHPQLFQPLSGPQAWAFPNENLKMAFEVYSASGSFKPWVTYTSGAYASFLSRGQKAAGAPNKQEADTAIAVVGALLTDAALVHTGLGMPSATSKTPALLRVLEVVLGAGLLWMGLYRLARPVTEPVVQAAKSTAKSAAKVAAVAA